MLTAYREGSIDLGTLKIWIRGRKPSNHGHNAARGNCLKTSSWETTIARAWRTIAATCFPSCEKLRNDRRAAAVRVKAIEYEDYSNTPEMRPLASGNIAYDKRLPLWTTMVTHGGSSHVYTCFVYAGSIWAFGEPERTANGFLESDWHKGADVTGLVANIWFGPRPVPINRISLSIDGTASRRLGSDYA